MKLDMFKDGRKHIRACALFCLLDTNFAIIL